MFWGYSMWWQIKQNTLGLNTSLSLNFWWLERASHEIFTEVCDVFRKAYFGQKNCSKWAKHGFATISLSQKDSPYTHFLEKKKISDAVVSKEGDADSVLWHEKTNDYWFLWKGETAKCFLSATPQAKFTLFIEWPLLNDHKICFTWIVWKQHLTSSLSVVRNHFTVIIITATL